MMTEYLRHCSSTSHYNVMYKPKEMRSENTEHFFILLFSQAFPDILDLLPKKPRSSQTTTQRQQHKPSHLLAALRPRSYKGLSQHQLKGCLALPNQGAPATKASGTLDQGHPIMLLRKCQSFLRPTPL